MGVSVVVPVYNSSAILPSLVARLTDVRDRSGSSWEAIFVNDGSRDDSWEVIQQLAREHPWVRGINLMRNFGQHNALLCGIRAARKDTIITMDDDLQHPPEEIPTLLKALGNRPAVVYGVPEHLPHSLTRNVYSFLTKRFLAWAMGLPQVQDISAFRAFPASLRRAFEHFQGPHVMLDVLLSWATSDFVAVRVKHDARKFGVSNYSFRRLFNQALLILTGFSTAPLRLASVVGFAFTLFGLVVLTYVVGRYFLEGSLPGFPFLASLIAVFSGAQLFALGIMGEYLSRMFHRSLERPSYVVREEAGRFEEASTPRHG